ncbi:Hypothetical protein CINCED_3A011907 [Cinara cedri]|uniref:DUF659 domain-containing protein n=1 Tax=Cinara cedri TaxID=506608 RepID=A0A5E4MDL7_9HEMI|nr:Hypothetical protein CINCED_3A011907 [Cinara cedri]
MPKQSSSRRLKSLISEFVKVDPERRSSITQHIKTEKRRRAMERQLNQKAKNSQQLLTNLTSKKSTFNMDLCRALISANIPLNKLQNTEFRQFLQLYTQKDVPTESTIRKFYLDDCYEEMMKNIRQRVFLKKIWISIDETTDAEGRQIANAIIGTLEENRADVAPYMVKCGKSLNALYSKMIHVTCAAHGLHRTCEEIFKTHVPNIPLPPESVITRWGTWLNASIYYCEYYKEIYEIVEMLNSEDASV